MNTLIIFDCDGVLVDSETITNQVLSSYLNEFGLNFSTEDALRLFRGGSLKDCISYVKENHNINLPEHFPTEFRTRMKASFEKELQPVEGVKLLLDKLESTPLKKCIASNGPMEKMETSLRVTGVAPYFGNDVFSAYQIQKWKPEPDLFLHAAQSMGAEPQNCIVVEDSPRGAEAARAAGMSCFGFGVYDNVKSLQEQGAQVFYNMKELEKLILKDLC